MFAKKILLLVSLLTIAGVSAAAFADGPFYNCQSNSTFFAVRTMKDSGGEWCVWQVRTGVTTPVGGYQPTVAVFDAIKFKVSHPSVANCSPKTLNASDMEFDGVTMTCSFAPVGASDRPQQLSYSNFMSPFELQQYTNNQWKSVGGYCPSASQNCRVAPVSQK